MKYEEDKSSFFQKLDELEKNRAENFVDNVENSELFDEGQSAEKGVFGRVSWNKSF